jgi:hypothetical protein
MLLAGPNQSPLAWAITKVLSLRYGLGGQLLDRGTALLVHAVRTATEVIDMTRATCCSEVGDGTRRVVDRVAKRMVNGTGKNVVIRVVIRVVKRTVCWRIQFIANGQRAGVRTAR